MRILYISKYAVNPNYGQPTRQFFYCKYLSRIPGNDVLLVSSRSTIVDSFPAFRGRTKYDSFGHLTNIILNGPVTGLGFNLRRIFSWLWFEVQIIRAFWEMRKWKPDVIVVSSLSLLTFLTGTILKWLLRIPLVVEVRDIYPLTLVEVGGFSRWHPAVLVLGWIEKLGYRQANAIVSSLPNLEPHIKNRTGHPKSVTYLPMGFDPELFDDAKPSAQALESIRTINSCTGSFSVGYCGAIGTANALREPLQAFRSLAKELPGAHFWIVGDGPMRSAYEQEFGSNSNIHFLGQHPKTDIPFLIAKFDVVVNPWMDKPIYRFGISPNKWIDYMHAAKPILISYDGHRFLIEENEIGWCIPPEDESAFREKIISLAKLSNDELNRCGRNGQKYVKNNLPYSILADRFNKLLIRLIQGNPTQNISLNSTPEISSNAAKEQI